MHPTHKILFNTLAMYGRTLVSVLVGLFSTRFVLEALGVSDFGIYGLVGAVIGWLVFLNASMANATQRFLSYHRNSGDTQNVFSTSVVIHFGIGIIFVVGLEIIGVLFLPKLNIQADRLSAAYFVLHCMVASTFFSVISTPYTALITSRENMSFLAVISIVESFCKLGLALFLFISPWDRLETYSLALAWLTCLNLIAQRFFCGRHYAKIKFQTAAIKASLAKPMLAFSAYNLMESVTGMLKFQGLPLLLNLFFGTVLNAAYSIANQVLTSVSAFSWNLLQAASPQIVSGIAKQKDDSSKKLAITSCKFSFLLVSVFSVPLILNIDFVLRVWLHSVPDFVPAFCCLALGTEMLNNLARGLGVLVEGKGNIFIFKIVMAIGNLVAFPIAYILLKMGGSPYSVFAGLIASSIFVVFARAWFAKLHVQLSFLLYSKEMAKVVVLAAVVFAVVHLFAQIDFASEWLRLVSSTVLSTMLLCGGLWFVLDAPEKAFVKGVLAKVRGRF